MKTTGIAFFALIALIPSAAAADPRLTNVRVAQLGCGRYSMSRIALPDHVSDGARTGERVFARAVRDYERGRSRRAARGFLFAARSLSGAALADSRMTAYRNAAFAWATANQLAEARAELARAARDDEANAAALTELLARLPVACRSHRA